MDFRNIVLGKIERNDPEYYLHQEIDVYYRYNWLIGQWFKLGRADPQVLELGCGLGWFGKIVLSTFELSSYLGIDIDNDVVEEARSRGGIHERLQYRTGDVCEIESLNLQERSYDYIVWFENLEHLQPTNFPYLINRVRRYLKSGGSLFVAVPNRIGGGGLWASGPLNASGGQHNPHHYFEPTLAELRFLFPHAHIEGYEPSDHLSPIMKKIIHRLSRVALRLQIKKVHCYIDHNKSFTSYQLTYLGILRSFPSLNRCFLIHEIRSTYLS